MFNNWIKFTLSTHSTCTYTIAVLRICHRLVEPALVPLGKQIVDRLLDLSPKRVRVWILLKAEREVRVACFCVDTSESWNWSGGECKLFECKLLECRLCLAHSFLSQISFGVWVLLWKCLCLPSEILIRFALLYSTAELHFGADHSRSGRCFQDISLTVPTVSPIEIIAEGCSVLPHVLWSGVRFSQGYYLNEWQAAPSSEQLDE